MDICDIVSSMQIYKPTTQTRNRMTGIIIIIISVIGYHAFKKYSNDNYVRSIIGIMESSYNFKLNHYLLFLKNGTDKEKRNIINAVYNWITPVESIKNIDNHRFRINL